MTYDPRPSVFGRVARRLRKYQNVRKLNFDIQTPIISITFDDFPKTAVTVGARELEARGMTGTFYTSANLANTTNHHGLQFAPEDLPKLQAAGHEIAGHTFTHADCVALTEAELETEISKNNAALKSMGVENSIDNFAYPFGQISAELKAKLAGDFDSLRGITDGVHTGSVDLNEVKSYGFYSSTADKVIARINTLNKNPGWMTVFTHDIRDEPTKWGCTPIEFKRLLDATELSGARVMTVRDALKALKETDHGQAFKQKIHGGGSHD